MGDRVDTLAGPPSFLIACVVQRAMVCKAERHNPLVANLKGHRAGLGEAEVVGLARAASADEACFGGHHTQVVSVPEAPRPVDQGYDRSFRDARLQRGQGRGGFGQLGQATLRQGFEDVGIVLTTVGDELGVCASKSSHRVLVSPPKGGKGSGGLDALQLGPERRAEGFRLMVSG